MRDRFTPTVYGVGFKGDGNCSKSTHGAAYRAWSDMLQRCYSELYKARRPRCEGCVVDPRWHNFQTFAAWFETAPNAGRRGFTLDKDLTIPGNAVYSPEACSFVPEHVNSLLNSDRGNDYSLGVTANGQGFRVRSVYFGREQRHGTYSDPDYAARVAACVKADAVRRTAHHYCLHLPVVVASRLMNVTWRNFYEMENT